MRAVEDIASSFDKYLYQYFDIPVVTKWLVDDLIYREGSIKASLDLGKSFIYVNISNGILSIDNFAYDLKALADELRYDRIYIFKEGKYGDLAFFRNGIYYKLYPVAMYEAPTIEVSGIKMHRVVDVTPWEDAGQKVELVGVREGHKVLDICTGLGYTAIHSLNRGAEVLTIEKDRNVLDLAKYNPWSSELSNIPILLGDAYDLVGDLPRNFFDIVIHDPPRMARAGELYSLDFYSKLYRVIRPGGRMYHYVGSPGHKRGKNIIKGVARRLKNAGFKVEIVRDMQGIYAFKI